MEKSVKLARLHAAIQKKIAEVGKHKIKAVKAKVELESLKALHNQIAAGGKAGLKKTSKVNINELSCNGCNCINETGSGCAGAFDCMDE